MQAVRDEAHQARRTVMIVDDEHPARELLKMLPCWQSTGCEIVAQAQNGAQALALYKQRPVDLIVTDIQMPVMNGLELSMQVKALNPAQKIVILSCHESFAYARDAIRLGIDDYLLKDSFTNEELFSLLYKIFGTQPGDQTSPVLAQNLQDLLRCLLKEDGVCPTAEPLEDCGFYCISVLPENCLPLTQAQGESLAQQLQQALGFVHDCGVLFQPDGTFCALGCMQSGKSELEQFAKRHNAAQAIRNLLRAQGYDSATLGFSPVYFSILQTPARYEQAREAVRSRVFFGKNKTLYFDTLRTGSNTALLQVLKMRLQHIADGIQSREFAVVTQNIAGLYVQGFSGIVQYHYLTFVNNELNTMLLNLCACTDIELDQIAQTQLSDCETVEEMQQWFCDCFTRVFQQNAAAQEQHGFSPRIGKVYDYLCRHYCDDISLADIAKQFHVHKVHLARTFKEETGDSLNNRIIQMRIKKAQLLLTNSELRINEIAAACGFHNMPGFNATFKKHTNFTPSEYRSQRNACAHCAGTSNTHS